MTDYNDGKWHGWNGGECPVHPETKIEIRWQIDHAAQVGQAGKFSRAGQWTWNDDYSNRIVAFRVVAPYVEPEAYEGECWAYHYVGTPPTTVRNHVGENSIHGKWTAEHVNGKLRRFSWEADE